MKVQKILLSRIDVHSEGWDNFIMDLDPCLVDRLAESMERVGQIYPLVLRKDMEWMFIVCGWTRYLALKKLGVDEAWARIYQKNELSDEEALWLSVEAECSCEYPVEKQKVILERFRNLLSYSDDNLAKKVAHAIGLEPTLEVIRKVFES